MWAEGYDLFNTSNTVRKERQPGQNLMPCTIKQLLDSEEKVLKIMDVEAKLVRVVALITSVENHTVKYTCRLDDQTGEIEAVKYFETDDNCAPILETSPLVGTYGRIVGALRNLKSGKYISVFRYTQVSDLNELTCHLLEVMHLPQQLKKFTQKTEEIANPIVVSDHAGTSKQKSEELGPNHKSILQLIQNCMEDSGMDKNDLRRITNNELSQEEIEKIIQDLNGEGLVYSTIDDDHYKSTTD